MSTTFKQHIVTIQRLTTLMNVSSIQGIGTGIGIGYRWYRLFSGIGIGYRWYRLFSGYRVSDTKAKVSAQVSDTYRYQNFFFINRCYNIPQFFLRYRKVKFVSFIQKSLNFFKILVQNMKLFYFLEISNFWKMFWVLGSGIGIRYRLVSDTRKINKKVSVSGIRYPKIVPIPNPWFHNRKQ
jgi:hypothetical protein